MSNKILIIEDNEFNSDMLSRRLKKKGYEVEIAANGDEGLSKSISYKPDLILLDLSLPLISGWEVAKRLKQSAETVNIPIIALSAYAMAADRIKAIDAGCDDFDTKPIEFPRLIDKINSFLIKHKEEIL